MGRLGRSYDFALDCQGGSQWAVINKSEPERQEAVILGEVWGLVVVMMVNYRHYLLLHWTKGCLDS